MAKARDSRRRAEETAGEGQSLVVLRGMFSGKKFLRQQEEVQLLQKLVAERPLRTTLPTRLADPAAPPTKKTVRTA
jgi:hypothetical protein